MSKRLGRPTVRTPARAKIICDGLARGLPFVHACAVAGITFQTFNVWRNRDEKFRAQIDESIAKGVDRRLKKIEDASDAGDWRASAWLLEHCQPEHFARNRLEVTGAGGAPLMGAVAIYLPRKDGDANGAPAVTVNARKEIENGR